MKKSAHAGLCLPILAGVFCPTLVAFAQDVVPTPQAASQPVATTVQVIVTGSNIPTAEEVGPNPVFNLNRDLIIKSGQGTTVEELLKIQPVMNAGSIPVSNNATGLGGPAGTASVSLRGFDPGATLVLIDGRRMAPFPGNAK
jgi:iron complex outermembrane receptor protein